MSRTAPATPRQASACSSRPTEARAGSWYAGSQAVAINRSIGAIAVKPGDPSTIYIGTDVARHGSSSVQRRAAHPTGSSYARRLHLDRQRRELRARCRTPGEDAGEPVARRAPGRARTGSRAESRSSSSTPTTRARSTRQWSATASGARPTVGRPGRRSSVRSTRTRSARRPPVTRSATGSSSTRSTSAQARRASTSATRLTISRGLRSGARTTPPRSPAIRPVPTRTRAGRSCRARRTGRTASWRSTTARPSAATTTSSRARRPSSASAPATPTPCGWAAR